MAGCRETYVQTATKIGPEQFRWLGEKSPSNATVPPGNETFYERAGFYIDSADYVLRPEVIESYYYAYRATGDTKYQEWAWEAYLAINETCRAGSGYSAINDVNVPGGGGFTDFQESFWFAEVLKYSYLIHAEVSSVPLPPLTLFSLRSVRYWRAEPLTFDRYRTPHSRSRRTTRMSTCTTPKLTPFGSLAGRARRDRWPQWEDLS